MKSSKMQHLPSPFNRELVISENITAGTVKRTCRIFNSFNLQQLSVLINDNIEYLLLLVIQRRFCQLQINPPVMASLYIYNLKINAKSQGKTLAR